MGTVLLWILGILLGIVLLALVIVLVLLNIRAGIEAVGVTGEVSVGIAFKGAPDMGRFAFRCTRDRAT